MSLSTYKKIRPQIRTGSAILWKGTGLFSRLISLWSDFTHASLVIRMDWNYLLEDRVFLIESLATGPVPRLLSKRLSGYKGEAYVFTPTCLSDENTRCIEAQAIMKAAEGVPYDYTGLIKNSAGRISRDAHAFFCSEFVDWIWLACGLDRDKKVQSTIDKAPRPGDIPRWYDGELIRIY